MLQPQQQNTVKATTCQLEFFTKQQKLSKKKKERPQAVIQFNGNDSEWNKTHSFFNLCKQVDIPVLQSDLDIVNDMISQELNRNKPKGQYKSLTKEFAERLYKQHNELSINKPVEWTPNQILQQKLVLFDPAVNKKLLANQLCTWLPQLHPERWWGKVPIMVISPESELPPKELTTGILVIKSNMKLEVAGALAGMAVDSVLFPLDTIKTRLQTKAGIMGSGGFRGVYSGLLSTFIGSAPNASIFFVTYEAVKRMLGASNNGLVHSPFIYMTAASCGEIFACTVRVPTEVIKQRMQIKQYNTTLSAVSSVLRTEGLLGFYRGFLPTVAREIPFTCIQFPLYEYFKSKYRIYKGRVVEPYEAALIGSLAGGIGAAITTPLDVCKTRIMLSSKTDPGDKLYTGIVSTLRRIVAEEGAKKLLAGIGPRVMWISIGGSIFFGVYEKSVKTFTQLQLLDDRR
ncbi:hypothetical protein HPULCUR_005636 [Helicostylum pulchrum]|uniref:Uncharacterized protein n=1 Tax=Helicostylum pulchrum TaxID=562976 RepID=A0ABP9XZM4_9FUNG